MGQSELLLTTRSEEETGALGRLLGSLIYRPLVVALEGELGAGKTVFVRGAAAGLGVRSQVSSPTFVLMKIYKGRLPLYHFDFYRLAEDEELDELGFDEYLPGDGVAFIEWGDRFPAILPAEFLQVKIERVYDNQGEGRCFRFIPNGTEATKIIDNMQQKMTRQADDTLNI